MKKALSAFTVLFLFAACTPKPESKPYTWKMTCTSASSLTSPARKPR